MVKSKCIFTYIENRRGGGGQEDVHFVVARRVQQGLFTAAAPQGVTESIFSIKPCCFYYSKYAIKLIGKATLL